MKWLHLGVRLSTRIATVSLFQVFFLCHLLFLKMIFCACCLLAPRSGEKWWKSAVWTWTPNKEAVWASVGGKRGLWRLRGIVQHAQKVPEDKAASAASCPHSPPRGPAVMSLPFQLELLKLQMNFFVGCGEVKLCLLLYIIILIMLNNFFQKAFLSGSQKTFHGTQNNFSPREMEYEWMRHTLL